MEKGWHPGPVRPTPSWAALRLLLLLGWMAQTGPAEAKMVTAWPPLGRLDLIAVDDLGSQGRMAAALSLPQIDPRIGGPDPLLATLPTLSQVQGWTPGQAAALTRRLLDAGYQIWNARDLTALGTLLGGLPSSELQALAPDVVLDAVRAPGFADHLDTIPTPLKMAFVEQIAAAVSSPGELVKTIPAGLAGSIPLALLAFREETLPRLEDLNRKPWTRPQATMFFDAVVKNGSAFSSLSAHILHGFTCKAVRALTPGRLRQLVVALGQLDVRLAAEQLSCLADRVVEVGHLPQDLDKLPRDLLLFLSPLELAGAGSCRQIFRRVGEARVDALLPPGHPQRAQLLADALACLGVRGWRLSAEDARVLGRLACDLDGRFVAGSGEALLPQLIHCEAGLAPDQADAVRAALRDGHTPYGPPSNWTVGTLNGLHRLLRAFDWHIVQSIPEGVVSAWLKGAITDPAWPRQDLVAFVRNLRPTRIRRDAGLGGETSCPSDKKALEDIETSDIVAYSEQMLQDCLNASIVAEKLESLGLYPFSEQQFPILKKKLDEVYPDGYPEVVIQRLGSIIRFVTSQDVEKWNVTSVEMLDSLLRPQEEGAVINSSVTATVIKRFMLGGNPLNASVLNTLGSKYVCLLSEAQLDTIQPQDLRMVAQLNLSACSELQKSVLYRKAKLAFQDEKPQQNFYRLIQPYLGGASLEDLRWLSHKDLNMDMATFLTLQESAVLELTPLEVRDLLGENVKELKDHRRIPVISHWIRRQTAAALEVLGIGYIGGKPSGYIVIPQIGRMSSLDPSASAAAQLHSPSITLLLLSFWLLSHLA
uniref:Mesothelin n=2 Tax=Ornithorhynchus anatinus TaxID=9258 RepID=A0A6I8P8L9_ORNAN